MTSEPGDVHLIAERTESLEKVTSETDRRRERSRSVTRRAPLRAAEVERSEDETRNEVVDDRRDEPGSQLRRVEHTPASLEQYACT